MLRLKIQAGGRAVKVIGKRAQSGFESSHSYQVSQHEAFGTLATDLVAIQPRLAGFIRSLGVPDRDISDCVSQTILKALTRGDAAYDPKRGHIAAWIYGI